MIINTNQAVKMQNSPNTCEYFRKKTKGKISANSTISTNSNYYLVMIDENPIDPVRFYNRDPNLRATHGLYSIRFSTESGGRKVGKYAPFIIGQDLIYISLHVFSYEHLIKVSEYYPEIKWLLNNTTLTPELFELAKEHAGTPFRFTIKFEEYADKIRKKYADENNGAYLNSPFGFYHYDSSLAEKYKMCELTPRSGFPEICKKTFEELKKEEK